jgi:predicted ester cyclase
MLSGLSQMKHELSHAQGLAFTKSTGVHHQQFPDTNFTQFLMVCSPEDIFATGFL